ncbi:MAG: sigma-54-dependent transcriptional regulator [Candidatus Eiseniibacteriota bacterium]
MADLVLVVDDEPRILESLTRLLEKESYTVLTARDGAAAETQLEREPDLDLVLLDVALPGGENGLALLERWSRERPGLAVVLMSGHGTIEMAVQATRLGAFDFLEKPLSSDQVLVTLRNAGASARLKRENAALRESAGLGRTIVGRSEAIRMLIERIELAAPTTATVLVQGESGTGKELVGRALHDLSPRRDQPFIALNCAALPEELVESELFGHEKGAFTGAVQSRRGKFEEAHRGTLFLDEIGDMSPRTQAKLLRVLQDGLVTRVGANQSTRVDVRVIAATNQPLEAAIANGSFREDLFYRLNVVPLLVPPLRERPEDLGVLAEHFLALIARQMGRKARRLDRAALSALARHSWPGNVRELRNLLERLVILTPGETISEADVLRHIPVSGSSAPGTASARTVEAAPANETHPSDPEEDGASEPAAPGTLRAQLDAAEKAAIEAALERAGSVARAAELLGLERSHLYKKLRKHRLPY